MDKYKLELNKSSSKYLQIYNFIKQLIISGEIKEHEKLHNYRNTDEKNKSGFNKLNCAPN